MPQINKFGRLPTPQSIWSAELENRRPHRFSNSGGEEEIGGPTDFGSTDSDLISLPTRQSMWSEESESRRPHRFPTLGCRWGSEFQRSTPIPIHYPIWSEELEIGGPTDLPTQESTSTS